MFPTIPSNTRDEDWGQSIFQWGGELGPTHFAHSTAPHLFRFKSTLYSFIFDFLTLCPQRSSSCKSFPTIPFTSRLRSPDPCFPHLSAPACCPPTPRATGITCNVTDHTPVSPCPSQRRRLPAHSVIVPRTLIPCPHITRLSAGTFERFPRSTTLPIMPKHHLPSHQHIGSRAALASAVPHHLQALCCLQLAVPRSALLTCPPRHQSLACSHAPSSSCSHQLPQHRSQMRHSPPVCNVQKPQSELSKELSTTQKASNSQTFTPATPLARGLQKPSHGLSTPPATFRSAFRSRGNVRGYRIQVLEMGYPEQVCPHPSVHSGDTSTPRPAKTF